MALSDVWHLQWWHPLSGGPHYLLTDQCFFQKFAHLVLNCPLRNAHGRRSPLHLSERPSRQLSATNHNSTTLNGSKHKRGCLSRTPINFPWSPPPPQFMSDLGLYCQYSIHIILIICTFDYILKTSLPYFRVKLSCVCLMFAYRKKNSL